MGIINIGFINEYITQNEVWKKDDQGNDIRTFEPVPYRWTHGATKDHLGDGLLIYSIIQMMRFKVCVCLGSGGGFIPRIMTQARLDLYDQGIFEGDNNRNWGDIGATYLVDADNGIGGNINYSEEESFFRTFFTPRFIKDTTENAYYNFFIKQDIQIDYLHIDAGHSYEDVKKDFELYSKILAPNGIISIHDTDKQYQKDMIVSEDEKEYFKPFDGPTKLIEEIGPEWKKFNFFNSYFKQKPASTGLTLLQRA